MIFIFLLLLKVVSACHIGHYDLWTCALKDACINNFQLHAAAKKRKSLLLKRPFIMAVEGPKYKKLFEDCDVNNDGCISLIDIQSAGKKCERSCIWRDTMHDLLC